MGSSLFRFIVEEKTADGKPAGDFLFAALVV